MCSYLMNIFPSFKYIQKIPVQSRLDTGVANNELFAHDPSPLHNIPNPPFSAIPVISITVKL